MSYCRWSCDDFTSDVYCYHSHDGYMTHIAAAKKEGLQDFLKKYGPNPMTQLLKSEVFKKFSELPEDEKNSIVKETREKTVIWRREWDKLPMEKIGLEFDGKSFKDETLEDLLLTLVMLKESGYHIPKYVFLDIQEELKEE